MSDTQFNPLTDGDQPLNDAAMASSENTKASYEDRLATLLHFLVECVEEGEMPDIDEPYGIFEPPTVGAEIVSLGLISDEKYHAKFGLRSE